MMAMQRGLPDRFPPSAAARAARLGRKPKQPPLKANGAEDLRGMARALAII